jgi:CheY-like chemotaxis protein
MTAGADGSTDEFLAVIRETRARYVAGFPNQLDQLRSLSASPTLDQLQALRTAVHRMAGLSGTLGFHAVGAQAAELETLVETSLASGTFGPDGASRLIASIASAFARDLATPPGWAAPEAEPPAATRILIVEDDDDQRTLVCRYLEQAGFEAVGVASGDLAVDAVKRERPSLVMLDVHLPGLDGYSICRLLKADPATRDIPIVFATTRAALNERLAGLALADDYFAKPIDLGELVIRARRLIEARRSA